jgi:hypothetical protein
LDFALKNPAKILHPDWHVPEPSIKLLILKPISCPPFYRERDLMTEIVEGLFRSTA